MERRESYDLDYEESLKRRWGRDCMDPEERKRNRQLSWQISWSKKHQGLDVGDHLVHLGDVITDDAPDHEQLPIEAMQAPSSHHIPHKLYHIKTWGMGRVCKNDSFFFGGGDGGFGGSQLRRSQMVLWHQTA